MLLACPPSFLPEKADAEGKGLGLVELLLLVPDTYNCHSLTKEGLLDKKLVNI